MNRFITDSDLAPAALPVRGVLKCARLLSGQAPGPSAAVVVAIVVVERSSTVGSALPPLAMQFAERVDFLGPVITPPTLYALQ